MIKKQWNRELVIAILFFLPQINYYIAALLSMNGLPTITRIVYLAAYALGVISYLTVLNRKVPVFAIALMGYALFFSYLFNRAVAQYMFNAGVSSVGLALLFAYFPLFPLLLAEVDLAALRRYFQPFARATLATALVTFGGYLFGKNTTPPDYMSFAYMMYSPLILCFLNGLEGNVLDMVLAGVGAFVLFIVGCRGAVLALAVFLALCTVWFLLRRSQTRRALAGKLLLLIALVLIAVFSGDLIRFAALIVQKLGFHSRTLDTLIRGGGAFVESEGREGIWRQAVENIGFFGKGLFGDRTVLLDEYGHAAYAHNLALELMLDLGGPVGAIITVMILYACVRAVRVAVQCDRWVLLMVFAGVSVILVKHMISTSFLISVDFWFYMGFVLCVIRNRDTLIAQEPEETL